MALILTFLGKGGTGRTISAIAAARQLAQQGKRVLLAIQDPSPAPKVLLGSELSGEPQPLGQNLWGLQFQSTALLERNWDLLKQLERQYLRTPFFKAVYGQELGVLPGMDSALALNAIREYDASGQYDVIVYDDNGSQLALRMWGMPEILSWYLRRFEQVFTTSDFYRAVSPFFQPVAGAVLNVSGSVNDLVNQPASQANDFLGAGRLAINDPNRVAAYLVTTADTVAVTTAHHLWGSAQQVGLTVGGVLVTAGSVEADITERFAPLPITALPAWTSGEWQAQQEALPDLLAQTTQVPRPITVDEAKRQVSLFLPGFDKQQVKLTQYGPEVTVEAGDQRRNVFLPPSLSGQAVTGAKFQDGYLVISF
jgi:anion-transporting  ArsA/GET3 family ATPase